MNFQQKLFCQQLCSPVPIDGSLFGNIIDINKPNFNTIFVTDEIIKKKVYVGFYNKNTEKINEIKYNNLDIFLEFAGNYQFQNLYNGCLLVTEPKKIEIIASTKGDPNYMSYFDIYNMVYIYTLTDLIKKLREDELKLFSFDNTSDGIPVYFRIEGSLLKFPILLKAQSLCDTNIDYADIANLYTKSKEIIDLLHSLGYYHLNISERAFRLYEERDSKIPILSNFDFMKCDPHFDLDYISDLNIFTLPVTGEMTYRSPLIALITRESDDRNTKKKEFPESDQRCNAAKDAALLNFTNQSTEMIDLKSYNFEKYIEIITNIYTTWEKYFDKSIKTDSNKNKIVAAFDDYYALNRVFLELDYNKNAKTNAIRTLLSTGLTKSVDKITFLELLLDFLKNSPYKLNYLTELYKLTTEKFDECNKLELFTEMGDPNNDNLESLKKFFPLNDTKSSVPKLIQYTLGMFKRSNETTRERAMELFNKFKRKGGKKNKSLKKKKSK